MNARAMLEQAVAENASDIFLVAGRPLSLRKNGVLSMENEERLLPDDTGQNARLAARLTGFKIDIKSETQAREAGDFEYYQESDDEEGEDSMEEALAGVELDEEPKTEEISEETSTEEE